MSKFNIPSSMITLELAWSDFKKYINGSIKQCSLQYTEYSVTVSAELTVNIYQLIAADETICYTCEIQKAESPAQGSDQKDFEDNFKANCNKQLQYIDASRGGLSIKPVIHKIGYSKCPVGFYASMGSGDLETKHQPLSASLVKSYDADKKCTKVIFTVPFTNGIDIEGCTFSIKNSELGDVFRAWLEHPLVPGTNQCWLVYDYLLSDSTDSEAIVVGPTCSFIPGGMKVIFEYYSMSTEDAKTMLVNLQSWLNTTTEEKVVYTMPLT